MFSKSKLNPYWYLHSPHILTYRYFALFITFMQSSLTFSLNNVYRRMDVSKQANCLKANNAAVLKGGAREAEMAKNATEIKLSKEVN